jgi:phosphoglycolate phosphatase-like HAD superfamily hydrolase
MENRAKTIILDLDGTVFFHKGTLREQIIHPPELLPGIHEKFQEWERNGYNIIILTGRRESMRSITEHQLESHGLAYDQLVMGVGGGKRILVNDRKSNGEETAFAINVPRNKGLTDVSF